MLLPETGRRLAEQVATAQAVGEVPVLVAGVVRDGTLVHVTGAGADTDPVDTERQYRIGSITKTMTAVMVLQLRDAGLLTLDDLLYRHLPGTSVGGVTLRQLLGHASGLRREPAGQWWERAPGVELETLVENVAPDTLAHPPYRRHHYSNLAYGLLGAVLERVTGQRWAALLEDRLTKPLRLHRTTYHPEEPFARGYVVHPWHGTLREEPRHDSRAMAPAGQLWSTLADLGRWAAFLIDPVPEVLAGATLAEMCVPVAISDPDGWTAGHGLGLALWRVGERVYVGHSGSMPGYLAILVAHRPSRTAVVAFANAYTVRESSLSQLGSELLTTVLDREPALPTPWRPGHQPPPEVLPLCGRWWWMGQEYEIGWDAGELLLAPAAGWPGRPSRFVRDGADRWRGVAGRDHGELLLVHRHRDGEIAALDISSYLLTRSPD